jgi:hypothetical protein
MEDLIHIQKHLIKSSGFEKKLTIAIEDCIFKIAISRDIFEQYFYGCGLSIAIYLTDLTELA